MNLYPWKNQQPTSILRRKKQIPRRRQRSKVGRNAPCPCGSMLKFKHCCYESAQKKLYV